MATEELKILITAEAQDAINKVKAVKDNLTDINKNSGINKMTSGFSEGTSAASQLADKLSSIRGMNFFDLVAEFGKFGAQLKSNKMATAKMSAEINYYSVCIKNAEKALEDLNKELALWEAKDPSITAGMDDESIARMTKSVKGEISSYNKALKQDTAKLNSLNEAAANSSKKLFAGMSKGAAAAASAVAALVAVLGTMVLAMGSALRASERLRANFFDASRVGMSTAAYQEWSYVLGQVGVEADALSDFIKSLSAAQNDLRDGSEAMTEAFKQLGFNIDEVVNMGQEELFVETIKRLQQLEDQVQKTSIAYRIFGEDDAAKVANVLSLNNQEMERMIQNYYLLGGGASDAAIQKSLALQGAVSNLKLAWQGVGQTIGEFVMPLLTKIVNAIAVAIAAVNMFLRAVFGLEIVSKGSSSGGVNKAAASIGGYSNAVKDATAAAKELKRTTMGFDELNVVSDPNKDAGGGAGSDLGSIGGGGSFEMPELSGLTENFPALEKAAAWIEKYKEQIKTLTPVILTAIGLVGGIACLATGNWVGAIALLSLAGIGIAIGAGNGTWKKLFGGIADAAKNAGKKFKKAWDDVKKWWDGFWPKVKKTAENVWNAISTFFKNCWNGIKNTAKTVWDAISNFFKTCWNGIKNTATTVFNAVVKFFSTTWNSIKTTTTNVWNAIKTFLSNTWNAIKTTATTVWNAIAKFFSDTWNSIKTVATIAWNAIKQFLSDTWNSIKNTATTIWNAIKAFFDTTWDAIKTAATTAWNAIKTLLETTWNNIKTTATTIWTAIKQLFIDTWENIKTSATNAWNNIKTMLDNTWNAIKTAASTLCDNLKNFFINAWNAIKSTWDTVKGYFQGIWDAIKNAASSMLESVKSFFSSAWTSIKNTWSGVSSWFGDVWTGIKGKFSDVVSYFGDKFGSAVTTIKNKWSDIKDWFQEKWNSVKNVFTTAGQSIGSSITTALKNSFNNFMSNAVGKINGFIRAINSAIGLINKIPGVNIGTLRELSVPQLAKGGIVTGSILANIGERGREAVLPLENNTGWMDALADRIAARNGGSTRVVLQVDGRELGWATIEQINAITKQTGGLQLVL